MLDSEDIIHAVKKCKAIWDLDNEGYHNKHQKDEAWNKVCLDLISDWNIMSEGDKYMRQLEIKKKWNNIRDYYKKLLAEKEPGEQVRAKKRRYLYSDILDFIRPVYDKRRPEVETIEIDKWVSDDSTSNDTSENVEIVSRTRTPKTKIISKRSKVMIKPVNQRRMVKPTKVRRSQMTAFERSVIKNLEKTTAQENDPDLSFLKSLIPDIQKLTSEQKIDFKVGIMELYKNITKSDDCMDIAHNDFDHLSEQIKVETVRLDDDEVCLLSS